MNVTPSPRSPGIKLCQAYRKQYGRHYISVMPCNLYGPNDNFDPTTSHVLPALIRKFHEAKAEGREQVVVWGTGTPLREFLHVDDLARGVVFCLDNYDEYEHINCGAGSEISIRGLAESVARATGFHGPDRVRHDQARRHAAQADGFEPHSGARDGSRRLLSMTASRAPIDGFWRKRRATQLCVKIPWWPDGCLALSPKMNLRRKRRSFHHEAGELDKKQQSFAR